MEGDIARSQIAISVRKVHSIALLYLGIINKYTFESASSDNVSLIHSFLLL